jgi:hypothetical protein
MMNATKSFTEISALQSLTRPWQIHAVESLNGTCSRNYTVVSGDTCSAIETKFGITFAQFYEWNPTMGNDCQTLYAGRSYCVDNLRRQGQEQCQSASIVLLWFMSMFTLTAIWLLLLGSRDLRRYIDKRAMEILPFQRFSHIVYLRCAVGIAGSLLLQIGFTIWTARIFAYGQSYVELESIAMGWFLRPLPALPCLLVIAFDGKRFNETFQEMLVVESFLTLIPLAQMWHIVLAMSSFTSSSKAYLSSSSNYRLGSRLLLTGAGLAIVVWVYVFAVVSSTLVAWGIRRNQKYRTGRAKVCTNRQKRLLGILALAMGSIRLLGSFLLWGGAILLDPVAFCPSSVMMRDVTLLWAFAPVLDNLWRATFHFKIK